MVESGYVIVGILSESSAVTVQIQVLQLELEQQFSSARPPLQAWQAETGRAPAALGLHGPLLTLMSRKPGRAAAPGPARGRRLSGTQAQGRP